MLRRLGKTLLLALGGIAGGLIYYVLMYCTDLSFRTSDELLRNNSDISLFILCVFTSVMIVNVGAPALMRRTSHATFVIGKGFENVPPQKLLSGTIGLILGFIIALLISWTYRKLLHGGWYVLLTMGLYIVLGYVGFAIGISKTSDLSQLVSRVREEVPTLDRRRSAAGGLPKIFDTSVIIDGRIADVMRTGFLDGPILVPDFVLIELQHIADSANPQRRTRGRRGLEILEQLQEEFHVTVCHAADKKEIAEIPEVDVKLIKLCKMRRSALVTTDYNLNKVARINDITVLNINDLVNAIKPIVLPGEAMMVDVIKQGKNEKQGIGYLDDGTMIVVEDGRSRIGETVRIEVTSAIQTSAGKMIFGRCGDHPAAADDDV